MGDGRGGQVFASGHSPAAGCGSESPTGSRLKERLRFDGSEDGRGGGEGRGSQRQLPGPVRSGAGAFRALAPADTEDAPAAAQAPASLAQGAVQALPLREAWPTVRAGTTRDSELLAQKVLSRKKFLPLTAEEPETRDSENGSHASSP